MTDLKKNCPRFYSHLMQIMRDPRVLRTSLAVLLSVFGIQCEVWVPPDDSNSDYSRTRHYSSEGEAGSNQGLGANTVYWRRPAPEEGNSDYTNGAYTLSGDNESESTARQSRAIANFVAAVIAHNIGSNLKASDDSFDQAWGVAATILRNQLAQNCVAEAFPQMKPFQQRTLARVAMLILDDKLSTQNLGDATFRGECIRKCSEESAELGVDAQAINFLILLRRQYNK